MSDDQLIMMNFILQDIYLQHKTTNVLFPEDKPSWPQRITQPDADILVFDTEGLSVATAWDNWCTVGRDGGCRVGEVRASTTSPMPDHKGFKLQ